MWVSQKLQQSPSTFGAPTVTVRKGGRSDKEHSGFFSTWHKLHKSGDVWPSTFARDQQAGQIWACVAQNMSLDTAACTTHHRHMLTAAACC